MLIIQIHNDGTGTAEIGNYDVEVLITKSPTKLITVAAGRVQGHIRSKGWKQLLKQIVEEDSVK